VGLLILQNQKMGDTVGVFYVFPKPRCFRLCLHAPPVIRDTRNRAENQRFLLTSIIMTTKFYNFIEGTPIDCALINIVF
jgi:hypothetical protein